jgi:adenine-specific DNA-methyltransferase
MAEKVGQQVERSFNESATAVSLRGNCLETLRTVPSESVRLVVTSPPYNIGKDYEEILPLEEYLEFQRRVISECLRVLTPDGNICWQVGFTKSGREIVPLDVLFYPLFKEFGLFLRNRIVWTFGHGPPIKNRFNGRHETVLWFSKSETSYFDVDPVRVPQKYPGKRHYRGPKKGEYSGHPLGKNPGDVWDIPNVKAHHPEKSLHQCQFPIALVQRLVRALTKEGDWVLDPFSGVGSAVCGALIEGRRGIGCELHKDYADIAEARMARALNGELQYRDIDKPIQIPDPHSDVGRRVED